MSRPRSRSPHYRRLEWEEPEFPPHKVLEKLRGNPRDRSHRHRAGPGEHGDFFRDDVYPEGRRRTPPFPDDNQFDRPCPEFYHGRLSPRRDAMRFENQRFSPPKEGAFDMDRRRGGFREHFQRFEKREPGVSWRREEQGRAQGRFRDSSPGMRYGDQRTGQRGGKTAQGPSRGRQRENPHHERATPFHRPRRETDDADRLGYRDEKDLVDTPRGGFGGGARGKFPRGDFRHSGSHFSERERNHGVVDNREMPQWQRFEDRRPYEPDLDRHRSPHSVGSSQERFGTSDRRLDGREDAQDHHFQDNFRDLKFHETRRSPALQEKPHTMRYGDRHGPMNHKGRGGGSRRGYSQSPGGRTRHPRNPPHLQESSQGYQDLPHEQKRPFREAFHGPTEDEPHWAEEDRPKQWEHDMPGHLDQYHGRDDSNPEMPRQRKREWSDQKANTMTVVTEETLTIKVDMSRPVNQNSPLCYSSDRQLSLDLVNVGRQRLDFLPMLKHSGTYRETDTHTGTFAQEIITLVHLVKDQYFRGNGVTLNKRFSAPQTGGSPEETEELTLNQRFTSNRGFSLETDLVLDEDEPVFSRLGLIQGLSKQPLRGPGDLRHDLERRRQERLEGVKVTIPGTGMSQQPLRPVSEPDTMSDHEEFSSWSGEQNRRWEGNAGPRRGPSNRANFGPQRRNNRFGNRRHNMHSSPAGPDW